MWSIRILLAIAAIAWADRLTAREYAPSSREALLILTDKPVQRVQSPETRLDPQMPAARIIWQLRDKDGNVIDVGTLVIRRRC